MINKIIKLIIIKIQIKKLKKKINKPSKFIY